MLICWVCPTLLRQLEARGKEDTEPYAFRTPRGRQVDNHYQVKLPWKKTDLRVPNSYEMALRRLGLTERTLKKSSILRRSYHKAIEAYIRGGYALKIDGRTTDKRWFCHIIRWFRKKKTRCCERCLTRQLKRTKFPYSRKNQTFKKPDWCSLFAVGVAGEITKIFLKILLHL